MEKCRKIASLIKKIGDKQDKYVNNQLKELNITFVQMAVLLYLREKEGNKATQKDVQNHLDVTHATTNGIVNIMEKKGFVYCSFDGEDKRTKNIYSTDKAIEIFESLRAFEPQMSGYFDGLEDEELDTLLELLEKVYANLKD